MKLQNYDITSHDVINLLYMWGELVDFYKGRIDNPNIAGLITAPLYNIVILFYAMHKSVVWALSYTVLPSSLAILACYVLSQSVLKDHLWSVLFALSLSFHPIMNVVTLIGLRESPLFMFFFFMEILAVHKRRHRLFVVFLILANLSRINANLINILLGAVLIASGRKKYGRTAIGVSLVTVMLGVGALFLATHLTGHPLTSEMIHLDKYGNTIFDAMRTIMTNPEIVLQNIWIAGNGLNLLHFAPLLLFPLLAPIYLIPGIAELVFTLGTTRSYWDTVWMTNLRHALGLKAFYHNNMSFVLPGVYVSAIYGVKRILKWKKYGRASGIVLATIFAVVNGAYHFWGSSLFGGPVPLAKGFNLKYYKKSEHAGFIDRAWALVPDDGRVKVKENLMGREAVRVERIYHLHFEYRGVEYEYILADLYSFCYMFSRQDYISKLERLLKRPDLNVVYFEDGVILMKKEMATESNKTVLDFMERNSSLLSENLFNPYVFDDEWKGLENIPRIYSSTQLIREK
jgi:uncharacterized membrane protein